MIVTRRSIRSCRSFPLVLALLGVTSCSGGLFGGGGSSGNVGSDSDAVFLVVTGSLSAVDPHDPTHVYSFGPDTYTVHDFAVGGEFQAATRSLADPRLDQLVYAQGERLYSVDLEVVRVDGVVEPPAPALLATFSAAVEEVTVEEDYSVADGERTYVVRVGDAYEVVAESDGVPTPPAPFPGTPITGLMDPATGAFLGWLALDAGSLIRVDRDLNTQFLTLADEVEKLGETCDVFLAVDDQLMSFDVNTEALVDIGYLFGTYKWGANLTVDGTLYFQVITDDFGWDVCRTDLDGPVSCLVSGDLPVSFLEMAVLETRLAYTTLVAVGGQGLTLRSIELDGSDPVHLDGGKTHDITFAFDDSPIRGDTVFYYHRVPYDGDEYARTVDAEGTGRTERQGGRWLGRQLQSEISFDHAREAERLFWLTDDTATISAVDPADPGGTLHTIGVLPPGISTFVLGPSYNDAHLGFAYGADGALHVYFFDSSIENSLYWVVGPP